MTRRKMLLLAGIGVLLCVYVAQTIGAHRSPVRTLTLADEPDTITISSAANGTVTLTKDGEAWLVDGLPAEENQTYFITDALKNVRTLGVVSRSNAEADVRRYGLDEQSCITVRASKDGTVLRTLTLGKTAVNADQTYIRVDGGTETLIASGNLHGEFDVTAEELVAEPDEDEETEIPEEIQEAESVL
ncbi:MAG: DUF4340 domain-containing protein [Treponema sp.]|nr:DUF4340 domain-containing protein [Treponema sp.]